MSNSQRAPIAKVHGAASIGALSATGAVVIPIFLPEYIAASPASTYLDDFSNVLRIDRIDVHLLCAGAASDSNKWSISIDGQDLTDGGKDVAIVSSTDVLASDVAFADVRLVRADGDFASADFSCPEGVVYLKVNIIKAASAPNITNGAVSIEASVFTRYAGSFYS